MQRHVHAGEKLTALLADGLKLLVKTLMLGLQLHGALHGRLLVGVGLDPGVDLPCLRKPVSDVLSVGGLLAGGVAVRVNDLPLAGVILVQRGDALSESVHLLKQKRTARLVGGDALAGCGDGLPGLGDDGVSRVVLGQLVQQLLHRYRLLRDIRILRHRLSGLGGEVKPNGRVAPAVIGRLLAAVDVGKPVLDAERSQDDGCLLFVG